MPIGQPFIQLIEVDSTNNYAMAQAQAHLADHGATWFAHTQNAGKGQRGKTWLTQPGENIILSVVIKPSPLKLSNQFILSAAVALACLDLFSSYAYDDIKIKWPNDIYWKDRKAGGILIENVVQGTDWKFAIAGVGVNINQTHFSSHLPNPVSLKQITGQTFDAAALAKELCVFLEKRWQQVLQGKTSEMLGEYKSHLYKLHEWVNLEKDGAVYIAMVKGINEKGELLVDTEHELNISIDQAKWVFP